MKTQQQPKKPTTSQSSSKALLELALQCCFDIKAIDIKLIDISEVGSIADYFLIASGKSDRQVLGIGRKIQEELNKHGFKPLSIEGTESAHWILMDYGDVIIHLFYDPTRYYYDLEDLWHHGKSYELHSEQDMASVLNDL